MVQILSTIIEIIICLLIDPSRIKPLKIYVTNGSPFKIQCFSSSVVLWSKDGLNVNNRFVQKNKIDVMSVRIKMGGKYICYGTYDTKNSFISFSEVYVASEKQKV